MEKEKKRRSLRSQMIKLNMGITLAALLLCGSLFAMSVWMIMQSYVEHDIKFFLTETATNLENSLTYLEDTVLNLRASEDIMQYLDKCGNDFYRQNHEDQFQSTFEKLLDISSQKNNGGGRLPLTDKIYLFDMEGNSYHSFYYALLYEEINRNDAAFMGIYQDYLESGETGYQYRKTEDGLALVFPLLDGNMDQKGTLVFGIVQEILENALEDTKNYKDSFWTISDRTGETMADRNAQSYQGSGEALQNLWNYSPYEETVENQRCLIYSREMPMDLHLIIGIPKNQTGMLLYDSVKIYIILIFVVLLLATVLFAVVIYRTTRPLQEVTVKLKQVQTGQFETKLPDYESQEFHEISQVFNEMTQYINNLIKQVYEKQISIKEMEIKFLQTQMNPHFMFNVLNMIALQARMDGNEEIFKMISSFSQLIQAKIYRADTEKVQIRQELEYVRYYLYLQNFRYGERLAYHIDIQDERILDFYIPKLCLQLIVENAVVHGIEPKMENGEVWVTLYSRGDTVYIDTVDNGIGFADGEVQLPIRMPKSDKGHNHVGLNNAHHLLKLMYGEAYGLYVYSKRGEGTTVSIRFPRSPETEVKDKTGKLEGSTCSE